MIFNQYPYDTLDEEELRAIFEEMKKDGVPINGFLDRCTLQLEGGCITVGVRAAQAFCTI